MGKICMPVIQHLVDIFVNENIKKLFCIQEISRLTIGYNFEFKFLLVFQLITWKISKNRKN